MLDPKIIKTDPQKIIQMLKARDMADEISFQDLENLDVARKNMMKEIDSMRNQKNIVSVQISEKCKRGENADKLIQEMRDLEQVLKESKDTKN
jgi:seryl-tRNA synthetase